MKAWKFTFAALVIFAAGAIAGSAWVSFQTKTRRQQEVAKRETVPFLLWQRFELLRRTERQLELTSEQRTRIETQIKESQERFRKMWEPMAPAAHSELEQLRRRVFAEMTSAQKSKFEELLRQRPGRRPGEAMNPVPAGGKMSTNTESIQPAGN